MDREADLVEALAGRGLVAAVGAGGKKTTLWRLAASHDRAVVTAATRIPLFDDRVTELVETDDPVGAVEDALAREAEGESPWPLGVVPGRADDVRYEGYDTAVVSELAAAVGSELDAILLKADGARNRLFKAPGDHEPQIPDRADTVVPIASATVVGRPLDEASVHRPELVSDVGGLAVGSTVEPIHVARVLASDRGGLKRVPASATAIPVVNMCDDEELTAVGREVAEAVLDRADVPRVVLTRMDEGRVVEIVE